MISGGHEAAKGGDIDLLISDIDGTLVTLDKHLTSAAAVIRLSEAGVAFTLV